MTRHRLPTDDPLGEASTGAGRTGAGIPRPAPGGGFEVLFAEQYTPMVRVAYLLLGRRDEAEDVVQDAFARVDLRWSRLDNPGGYLRRCVVNGATDLLRRRRLERRAAERARHEHAHGGLAADEMSDALAALPARRRAAVVLRYWSGLTHREIAEVLGVRPGTVKSMLHRALAQLREEIER
ncbi:MAG TPA: sigma-70 family RNA polymerase sigma factor [Acidimicrobiales bacterium]|nr:sigma-70 family RNA polymerase sigma factor [Acidimicrobiales bacterium]